MAERYGTDLNGLGGFEGGVTSENGAALVSTSSDGETALLFGPAALREIQAGVANGDFAISPDDSTGTITTENPLPYWTWTPAALITAAIITDVTAGSTKVFKVSCAAASNLQTAYLTRFIPVASSGDRGKTYVPLFRFGAGTGASAVINVRCRYYQQDQTTAVGTEYNNATTNGTATIIPQDLQFATIPSDAAFLKITIEFKGTVLANTSILQEVRVISGDSYIFLTETTPSASGPGQITVEDSPGRFKFNLGINVPAASVFDNSVEVASLTSTGAITSTGLLTASAGITATGLIATERASALDEAFTARQTADGTARFALYSNGAMEWGAGGARDLNLYRASAGLLKSDFALAATNISLSGSQGVRHDTPATTTQTSSAGIWVLVSGTNYQLRRNSSSARYKTNIVDADEVVLEAARKVKPRHYESTIEDENGATRLGFIAEEIHDAGLTHAVGYDSEGKPETIDPTALIAALWHRVSDLEDRLKALEAK